MLDDPEKAIDLDFCRRQGVVVLRRNTTGGTIYAGKGSAMICYYLRTSDPGFLMPSEKPSPNFWEILPRRPENSLTFPQSTAR